MELKDLRELMWEFWTPPGMENPPCLRCEVRPAITIHENVPRSIKRFWELEDYTLILPVCRECHEIVQDQPDERLKLGKKAVIRARALRGEHHGDKLR